MPPRKRIRATPRPNSIAHYRAAAGLTQGALAKRLNTSVETIYRLETGGIGLDQHWASLIAPHLTCEPGDLLVPEGEQIAAGAALLPVVQGEIARPLQMLGAIGDLIRSGAFADAASACRTLAKLLTETARNAPPGRP